MFSAPTRMWWAQYLAQEAQIEISSLPNTTEKTCSYHIVSLWTHVLNLSFFRFCPLPISHNKVQTDSYFPEKRHLCCNAVLIGVRCATTSPICSWNYEMEGQLSLQCGKDTECTKNRTQAFTCCTFISLWFEIIRMDQFWNNSSSYNTPQRFQDYSPQVVSSSIANPVP